MAWIGPTISAVGSVAGSALSAGAQSNLNLANRTWSAQQAEINRQFQAAEQVQAENYNTMMSDTAVTRRSLDLKEAGLNPMLAVGNPASAPQMGAPSGSMASTPSTANPGAYLGAGLSSAVSQAAQVANTMADTDKKAAEAKAAAAAAPFAGAQAAANVQATLAQTGQLKSAMYELDSRFDLNTQNTAGLMQNQEFQRELFPLQQQLQQLDIQRQRYGLPALAADADFWKNISPGAKQLLIGAKEAMTPIQQGSSAIRNLATLPMVD